MNNATNILVLPPSTPKASGQRTEQWHAERLGRVTGTRAYELLASNDTRRTLMGKLIAEMATGQCADTPFSTRSSEKGKKAEPAAAADYEMRYNAKVETPRFVSASWSAWAGCSPDALVNSDGGADWKCLDPKNHARMFIPPKGKQFATPDKSFRLQCDWCALVCERDWWDLVYFNDSFPEPLRHLKYRYTMTTKKRDEMKATALEFFDAYEAKLQEFGLWV